MLVVGVDLETTGLDAEKHFITEIGACLFDGTTWECKGEFQTFVYDPKALPLTEEIKQITKISDADVMGGRSPINALRAFEEFIGDAGAIIAHNKDFEKAFFKKAMEHYGWEASRFGHLPIVCSKEDIEHTGKTCTRLSHLALDYGCTIDGSKLHRALADVRVMGQLLQKVGKPIEEIINYAKEPWVYLRAKVKYEGREKAKAAGYGWKTCPGTYGQVFGEVWVKRIKESQVEAERAKVCDFERVRIEPPT